MPRPPLVCQRRSLIATAKVLKILHLCWIGPKTHNNGTLRLALSFLLCDNNAMPTKTPRTSAQARARIRGECRKRKWSVRKATLEVARAGDYLHHSHLWRVVFGDQEPSYSLAVALEDVFGVPVEAWDSLSAPTNQLMRLRGRT